jgi:predicted RNase H-like nuclease (RuvC/YqgF family)
MSTEKEKNATWDALESLTFKNRIKELEYDCAELTKQNEELRERCKQLASRMPEWPKGYRPTRKGGQNQGQDKKRFVRN